MRQQAILGAVLALGGLGGPVSTISAQEPDAVHQESPPDRLMRIMADHTGQDYEKVKKDAERDYFMSAEEAKTYGIIDAVFEGTGESLISLKQAAGGNVPTAKEASAADARGKK